MTALQGRLSPVVTLSVKENQSGGSQRKSMLDVMSANGKPHSKNTSHTCTHTLYANQQTLDNVTPHRASGQ